MTTLEHSRLANVSVITLMAGLSATVGSADSRSPALDDSETVIVDTRAPGTPFPHFWEMMFGSDRAILTLREDYRNDLRSMRAATGVRYLRFHDILHDQVGVYSEDGKGAPIYNFTAVDQIYDGLLANGVRPFVEIGFMPRKLARHLDEHAFWYKQIVSPPKDYGRWDDLIKKFARHLVDRYGIQEVSSWYFEVWNEPNIDFWTGNPKQQTYFELYSHTAFALKSVDPQLRVGGPATAAADWVDDFIAYMVRKNVPLDFISSHAYGDDTVDSLFHSHAPVPMDQRVCQAIRKVRNQIAASRLPHLPLMWTEWSVPGFDALNARDTTYVGAGLAENIHQCDGLVDMMSWWTFDDVDEYAGVHTEPFDGGFGLIGLGGIKKPGFYAFELLHRLGDSRIANPAPHALVTRHANGALAIAAWNLVDLDKSGSPRQFTFKFKNAGPHGSVRVSRVDTSHGNTLAFYQAMGSPRNPTTAQVAELNRESAPPPPESVPVNNGEVTLTVPANGLVLLEPTF